MIAHSDMSPLGSFTASPSVPLESCAYMHSTPVLDDSDWHSFSTGRFADVKANDRCLVHWQSDPFTTSDGDTFVLELDWSGLKNARGIDLLLVRQTKRRTLSKNESPATHYRVQFRCLGNDGDHTSTSVHLTKRWSVNELINSRCTCDDPLCDSHLEFNRQDVIPLDRLSSFLRPGTVSTTQMLHVEIRITRVHSGMELHCVAELPDRVSDESRDVHFTRDSFILPSDWRTDRLKSLLASALVPAMMAAGPMKKKKKSISAATKLELWRMPSPGVPAQRIAACPLQTVESMWEMLALPESCKSTLYLRVVSPTDYTQPPTKTVAMQQQSDLIAARDFLTKSSAALLEGTPILDQARVTTNNLSPDTSIMTAEISVPVPTGNVEISSACNNLVDAVTKAISAVTSASQCVCPGGEYNHSKLLFVSVFDPAQGRVRPVGSVVVCSTATPKQVFGHLTLTAREAFNFDQTTVAKECKWRIDGSTRVRWLKYKCCDASCSEGGGAIESGSVWIGVDTHLTPIDSSTLRDALNSWQRRFENESPTLVRHSFSDSQEEDVCILQKRDDFNCKIAYHTQMAESCASRSLTLSRHHKTLAEKARSTSQSFKSQLIEWHRESGKATPPQSKSKPPLSSNDACMNKDDPSTAWMDASPVTTSNKARPRRVVKQTAVAVSATADLSSDEKSREDPSQKNNVNDSAQDATAAPETPNEEDPDSGFISVVGPSHRSSAGKKSVSPGYDASSEGVMLRLGDGQAFDGVEIEGVFSLKKWLPSVRDSHARVVLLYTAKTHMLVGPYVTCSLPYLGVSGKGGFGGGVDAVGASTLRCQVRPLHTTHVYRLAESQWTHVLPTLERRRALSTNQLQNLVHLLERKGTVQQCEVRRSPLNQPVVQRASAVSSRRSEKSTWRAATSSTATPALPSNVVQVQIQPAVVGVNKENPPADPSLVAPAEKPTACVVTCDDIFAPSKLAREAKEEPDDDVVIWKPQLGAHHFFITSAFMDMQ